MSAQIQEKRMLHTHMQASHKAFPASGFVSSGTTILSHAIVFNV